MAVIRNLSDPVARGMVLVLALALGGCYPYYGYVDRIDELGGTDGGVLVIPANAPSILNGFEAVPDDYEAPAVHQALDIIGAVGMPVLRLPTGSW